MQLLQACTRMLLIQAYAQTLQQQTRAADQALPIMTHKVPSFSKYLCMLCSEPNSAASHRARALKPVTPKYTASAPFSTAARI
jgi:hypothetical protein